jgi:hypothetical protein
MMDEVKDKTQALKKGSSYDTPADKLLRNNQKHTLLKSIGIILVIGVVLVSIVLYVRWYTSQDHSVYGKLTSTSYNNNGLHFSFSYPSVMQKNATIAAKLPDAPIAYTYYVNQTLQAVIAVSHENISSDLKILNLKPSQYITQIRNGSGSYINALNAMQGIKDSAQLDFPGCKQTITTNSGKVTVLCVNKPPGYLNARLIGATDTTQYTLELIMNTSVWSAHQKAWQKIEKSFSFH